MLFAPDETLSDGAAEDATHGFFDIDNLPAWDTWLCYAEDAEKAAERDRWLGEGMPRSWRPPEFDSFLVSWAPPHLRDLVDEGIQVNPESCIVWADDVDMAFTRQLRALGIL